MNKKLIVIICLVLCFFITLSAVSAVEDMENMTMSANEDNAGIIQDNNEDAKDLLSREGDEFSQNGDNLSASNDEEILGDNPPGTFKDLADKINSYNDWSWIDLDRDYIFNEATDQDYIDGIFFNKNYVGILGNNHKIDAQGKARIFGIGFLDSDHHADTPTIGVILKDIVFANARNTAVNATSYPGNRAKNVAFGAVEFYGSGNITNCTFINNYAFCAAAIALSSCTNFNITDCRFIDNTGFGQGGGAIRLRTAVSGLTIKNCWFEDNYGESYGGAVHSDSGSGNGEITVYNCDFIHNSAGSGAGGLFFETPNGVVINSRFVDNEAPLGGALYWNGVSGSISNSNFTHNTATDKGGAIYTSQRATTTITTSKFENNSANYGGAIYFDNTANSAISICLFYNNSAVYDGGAIYCAGTFFSVVNSNFTKDSAENNGGAIYLDVGAYVYNCQFNQEHADVDGGGIYLYSKVTEIPSLPAGIELGVFSTNFTGCTAGNNGGAGFVNSNWGVVKDSILKDCTADHDGGAGYIVGNYGKLIESQLINNYALGNGGALYWAGNEGSITNTTYRDNRARGNGAGVYWLGNNGNITYSNFTTNVGDTDSSDGGAIYVEGNNTNITYADFRHCSAMDGSGIYIKGENTSVLHSNFTQVGSALRLGINERTRGGSIYIEGHNAVIFDDKFIRNNAGNGGSIYIAGNDADISYSTFDYTNVTGDGSSIYISGNGTDISHSIFMHASAAGDGGAIYIGGYNTNISSSEFGFLNATRGGAIFINGSETNIESNFHHCFANTNGQKAAAGGAIYVTGDNNKIYNSNFTITMAIAGSGGAIYAGGVNTTIYNMHSNITQAMGGGPGMGCGGAIYISGNGSKIIKSEFEIYNSTNCGGALYVAGNDVNVSKSSFTHGESKLGGVIYISGHNAYVEWCNLTRTHANDEGGLMYIAGDGATIADSRFNYAYSVNSGGSILIKGEKNLITKSHFRYTNSTNEYGGAIFIEGDFNNITYSTFEQCSSTKGGAIYINGTDERVTNSNFTRVGINPVQAISEEACGGAIFIEGDNAYISHDNFNSSVAYEGGFIFVAGDDAKIRYSNFTQSSAYNAGGAIDIQGNNAVIDESRFSMHYANVKGGAIAVNGNGSNVTNSNFTLTYTNSTSDRTYGGAIYVGGNDVDIVNCKFSTIRAINGDGGAIYVEGNRTDIRDSNFTICLAIQGNGGVLYVAGNKVTIDNCNSSVSQATGSQRGPATFVGGNGGVAYISGNDTVIKNSDFKRYNATYHAGAVFVNGDGTNISKSSFEYGESKYGGAIFINGTNTMLKESNLTHNHAANDGGIIYINGNHTEISTSRLEYSYAGRSGGAVFIGGDNNLITESIFTRNNATTNYGGSIYISGDNNNITYSFFEKCSSTKGGAIYINGTDAQVLSSNFTQNGINPNLKVTTGTAGGTIYIAGANAFISDGIFNMSMASEGGFIFVGGNDAKIKYSHFSLGTAYLEGGAIDIHGQNALIDQSSFRLINATTRGGAICVEGDGVNITNSNFTLTSVNNTPSRAYGGAIYVGGDDVDIVNSKFNITRAIDGGDGGAIYVEGNRTNIKDSNFTVAMAVKGSGGAVYVAGNNLTMDNCMALKTQAIGGGPGMGNGGTVYISGKNVIIKNSDFRQYNATLNGGSVFIKGNGTQIIESSLRYGEALNGGAIYINGVNVTLYKSNLTNNHARVDGGVIYVNGNHANITESRLEYSYTGHCGGTIYINGNNTIIKDSNLTHNNATADGGSIYISGHNTNITDSHFEYSTSVNGGAIYIGGVNTTVKGSTFAHHTATEYGGAIYIAGENTKVKSSNFSYCGAKDGGAIYIKGDGALIEGSGFDHYNVTHDGGAAYIQGDDVNITSSTFEYGEATHGGAIYIKGEGTYVDHSNFTRNHAKEDGGIIYVMGANTKINNSKLEYSYSNKSGGAIYVKGADARVINSNFTNNNATQKMGGSIYVEGVRANITGSRFTNCASREGGALYVKGANATVHNSNFTRNLAQSEDNNTGGGSIYIYGENAVISYSNFDQSMARDGGMIYIRGSEANITHSNFQRSQASRYGGAVFVAGINATIDSSTFTKHNATCGGAVYISGENTRVTSSGFTDSHASSNAGGVYLGPRTTVFNSTFNNNTAEDGGAMYNNGGTAIIAYSNFTDNIANKANSAHGGAIYWKGGSSNDIIIGCRFINNSAPATFSLGGAIFCDNGGQATFGAVIKDSVFYNNSVGRHGGAIDWFRADNGLIENCNFTDNHAYSNGGAIYAGDDNSDGENLTIRNCNFIRNDAGIAAGALCLQFESSHVVNTVFDSNKAYVGGTIYCVNPKASNTEYVNCTFINSTTCNTVRHSEADNGGAVFIATKNTNFTDCRFINCSVYSGKNGGAIYFKYGADGSRVDRCNFTNCTAISATGEGEGGAIYIDGAYDSTNNVYKLITNITIHNSTFINTSARNGGAIYLTGINTVIDNSTFKNNFATNYGGAVYIKAFGNDLALNNTVSNSTFKYNNAVKGGAIYLNAYANNITNSTISDNLATNGAGIYLENSENITIINTNITGNNATRGSGIYSQNSKYSLNGVKLLENQAHAGAFINKTVKMDTDGRYYVTAVFTGNDNLLNAIWNDETSEAVEFNGVTYWDAEGVNTTSTIPDLSVNEAGINITVLKTNLRAAGEVVVTDENGAFKYYFTDNGAKEYEFTFKHIEDKYYTNLEDSTSILTTNVIIEIESIDLGQNATVNVTLKDRDGNNLSGTVRVIINNTHNFTMTVTNGFGSVNNVSGLPTGLYNATVIYEGNESYLGSRNSTTFTVRSAVNVTINKTVDLSNVSVGKLINFTIEIHNSGESTANNVWITDTLPAGLVYIKSGSNATDQGIFENGIVKWNISTLGPHQTVRVWVQVNTTTNGTFSNVAVVNSTEGGTNSSNTTNVTVNPSVNLTVIKKADISRVQVGDYVNFTITVTNNGPSNATAVVITDVLDSAFEWINATDESRPDANRKITWTINKIANGTNASVWLLVKVLTNGTFTNVACVNCSENKTIITSNDTNVTVDPKVNLTVIKNASVSVAQVGDLINFTITVINHGPSNATMVKISDVLDTAFEWVGSYENIRPDANRKLTWTINQITNGTNTSVWVQVRLLTNGTFTNVATANCSENTTDVPSNDTNVTVNPKVNLTVVKTSDVIGNASVGDLVNFTIIITNHGPSNATDVNVTDYLPIGMIPVKYGANVTGVTITNTTLANHSITVKWHIDRMINVSSIKLWVLVNLTTNGTFTNVAFANSNENRTNSTNSTNITVNPKVNLTVIKYSNLTGHALVGDLVKFTINVTNHGPSNATNVKIVDELHHDFQFVNASENVRPENGKLTWTIDKLLSGNTTSVWVIVKVMNNGTFTNIAVVNFTETNKTSTNKTNITVDAQVNLTVVKTTENSTANVGDLANFTIIVTNNGLSNATQVNVTDLLPAGLVFVKAGGNVTIASITNTTLSNGTTKVVWNIAKILNGTSIKLWIQVNLTTNGTFTNVAFANSNENTTNSTNSTNITVKPVIDLVINKTVNKTDVQVGDTVTYTITVKNNGPSNATGVYVIDKLDKRLKLIKVIKTQGNYDNVTGKWTIGNITNGGNVTLKLIVQILTNGTIPNFANVTGNENDTNITNNNDTADNITAKPKVNLTVVKTLITTGDIYVGDLINYTITVTNNGPSNATNVQITDNLIPQFRFVLANGTYTNNTQKVNWTIPFIANGTSATVCIQVKVLSNGTLKNIATVNCTENKTDVPSNETNVTVKPQVNLTVIKTIENSTAHVGDLVNFTIIITNNGLSNATNVTVVDLLPLGMIYKNAGSNSTDYNVYNRILPNKTNEVKWVISKIMNGTSVKLWLQVNLTTNGTFRNVAVVNSTENNTNVSNGTNIIVKPSVNLIINKTVNKTDAYVGDIVEYTIEITNKGPSNATDVKVTDCLDEKLKYVNSTATSGKYNETTHIWTINNITSGAKVTLKILARIITNGTIPNIAIVNCSENTTNKNSSSQNFTAKPQVNLTVIKTAQTTGTIYVGDIVNYTITVTNNGLSNATNVTITENLIQAFRFVKANGTYVNNTQKITWTIDKLENGTSKSVWITVKVLTNGTLSNFVVVNSTENTTDVPSNVTNITVTPKVNLTVVKTSDVIGNASVGQLVNFTIIVTNYGPSNATNVNVTDLLPAGMVYKDSGSNITNLKGHVDLTNSSRVIWNIDKIANGTSVKLWLLVNLTTNGTFRNVAVVVSNENKTNTTNGTNITVKPVVDLVINKTVKNVTAYVGDIVEYTIVVTNNGPSNATGVYVFDELDSKLKYVNFTATQGNYNETTHKWVIGNITAGKNVTLTIRAKVIMNGTIPNFANVTGNENDTNITNNNDTSDNITALPKVNLTVVKASDVIGNASVGQLVNFTIIVTNYGPSNATGVNVTDLLPVGMVYKDSGSNITNLKGHVDLTNSSRVIWNIDKIANDTSVKLWLLVNLTTNGTFRNVAVVVSNENKTNTTNCTNITVDPVVDLVVNKTVNNITAYVGDIVEYTIVVTNNGPSNATGVYVFDEIDSKLQFVNFTATQGEYNETTHKWVIGNITAGRNVTLTIRAKVIMNGTIPNFANVTGNENDTNITNNNGTSDNITALPKVNLTVVKTSDVIGNASVGQLVKFTIIVTNYGPSNATDVNVTDLLPAGMVYKDSGSNMTNLKGYIDLTNSSRVIWNIDKIANGTSVKLWLLVNLITNGTFRNVAVVVSNENKTNTTNGTNITVDPKVNLTVVKTVDLTNATVGDLVNFTITVINKGPSNATNVIVSDELDKAFKFENAYGGIKPINGKLIWNISKIANGTNASVWVQVRLLTNGTFTNIAVAKCCENTTDVPSNDTNITVTPNVNLTIVKTANSANASVGDLVNFTITVTNNGLSNATNVVITDTLDVAFEFVKSFNNVQMDSNRKLTWTIDKLENNTSTSVWVQVRLLTNGTFTNVAHVNSTENTTDVPSNETNVTVAPKSNITIIKYADIPEGENVSVGDTVKFIIIVKNNGPSNATNVIVTDTLQESFIYYKSNTTCVNESQKVTWKFDKLNVNETVTIELYVNATKNGFYSNVAVVNSTESENVTSNETPVTILPAVNLTATKKANITGNATVGQLVNFTITIYNKGPSDATNVNITDILPSGMMFVSASEGGKNTTVDGITTVTWNIGKVTLRQTVEVWVVVKVLTNGTLRNVIKANSTENTTGITNHTDLNVTPVVDLVISKTVNKTTAYVGDIVVYTITVTNNGPSNATGVYVFDELDSKLRYDNSTATQGEYDKTTHKWMIGNITSGNTVTLTIKAKVIMNGTIPNMANVTGNENDTNKSNNNDSSDNVTALPKVNLTVVKTPQINNVSVGDMVNFTIVVTNNGLSNATNVKVSDELIAGFEFVNATGNYTRNGQKVGWTIDDIENGTSKTLILTVKVLTNGTLTNTVTVNCTENKTDIPSNTTNVTVNPKVNLTVVKSSNVTGTVNVGDLVKFTINVTNNGPSNATDVTIYDDLNSAFEIVSAPGNKTITGNKVTWIIPHLANGTSTSVYVIVKLLTNGTFENMASVKSNENTTNSTNGTNITVKPVIDLVISKTVNKTTVYVGDIVVYTITVTNNGPSNATGVYVFDELDSKLKYDNSTATQGEYDKTTHKWIIGNITSGNTVTLTIKAKVIMNGTIPNMANVTGNENDTNKSNNNDSSDNVTALPKVNLTVVKTPQITGNVSVGDIVNYTITVTNNGLSNATNVKITDELINGFKFDNASHNPSVTGQKVIWTIDKIANGTSVTVWITVKVLTNGTLSNFAVVNCLENTTDVPSNTTNITVKPKVNLTVVKSSNVTGTVNVGDLVKFTISVTNNGPSNATDVTIYDDLNPAFEIVSAPGNKTINGNKVTWIIPHLANGTSDSVTVTVKVLTNGTFTNVASVKSNENTTNSTNSTSVTVKPVIDLTINKTVDKTSVTIGDTIIYIITVKNKGPSNATNVEVSENLKGTVEITANPSKGTYTNYKWTIPLLEANETATLTLNVKVLKAETIENSVVVKADQNDTNTTNNNYTSDNVTVEKINTPIRLETENITYGDDEPIKVTLPTNATGKVNITVGNVTYPDQPINDGVVELTIPDLAGGEYNVTVTYPGDDTYKANSTNATFKVSPRVPVIKIEAVDIWYGEVEVLNVTVNAPGFVNITVDNGVGSIIAGLNHTVQEKNLLRALRFTPYDGEATWKLIRLAVGQYPVTATYLGNENYTSVSADAVFNVRALPSVVNVTADDIYVGEDAIIKVSLTPDATGNVTLTINGKKYTVNITDGKGHLTVPGLKAGLKNVTVKYEGDEHYLPSENSTTFNVKKIKPPIDVDSEDIYVGEDETITVTLPSDATGTVTITVNGKKYTADVVSGIAEFTIPGLKAGKYTVDASYSGDDKYLPTNGEDNFKVSKLKPDITVDAPDITVGEDGTITVTLPDDATGTVTIEVEGKTYTAKVKNGKAVFKVPGLSVGVHGIKVWYSGDDKYLPTETAGDIYVKPIREADDSHNPVGLEKHPTGNPIIVLILVLVSMVGVGFRKFKK